MLAEDALPPVRV